MRLNMQCWHYVTGTSPASSDLPVSVLHQISPKLAGRYLNSPKCEGIARSVRVAAEAQEKQWLQGRKLISVFDLLTGCREAETYFRHIVAHYEKLPAHILFTQAQPQYDYSVEMLGKYFGEKSGLLALSGVTVCSCEGFSYYWAGDKLGAKHGGFIRIRELWALFQGTLCPKEFSCSHNGIFVVSRPRILAQPKRLHQYVQSLFQVNRGDPLRHNEQNYHNNDQDAPAGEPGWYTLGHVLERSWMFVFNCTDPMVSNTCGNTCPGDPEDCTNVQQCQCLDE